jgi:LysM repeat protein
LITIGGNALEKGLEGKFDFNQVTADSLVDNLADFGVDKFGSKYAAKNLTDFGSTVFSFGKDVVANPFVTMAKQAVGPSQTVANRTATVAAPKASAANAITATKPNGQSGGGTTSIVGGSGSSGSISYTVRPGDTLGNIGYSYGSTASAIGTASGIQNLNLIYPGQVLTIPKR